MACRECTLSASIGFAMDLCRQENITIPNLYKIYENGYENEEEVFKALSEFHEKISKERKTEAQTIKSFAFPDKFKK